MTDANPMCDRHRLPGEWDAALCPGCQAEMQADGAKMAEMTLARTEQLMAEVALENGQLRISTDVLRKRLADTETALRALMAATRTCDQAWAMFRCPELVAFMEQEGLT